MTLGPYALVLSYILSSADYRKISEKIFVYRGMRIPKKLFKEQFGHQTDENETYLLNDTNVS
jgi:hypothetical protein